MEKFKEIFINEGMEMPTAFGIARVQRTALNESVEFELDDESRVFLKANLPLTVKIYEPTLKKIAENIIILNRQKHRKTDVPRIHLMNEPNYGSYRDSSFYKSIE
ncbi:hypothetical protein IGK25_002477 [Enterococcus sp. DIV1614a]|uniref:hypothetical protein n=1 Tax=Enterococcus TaxID=1350 RepID=UPI002DB6B937|nr:hypothetical protein [Enterococcus faecalis]MEB7952251.1 hypothetical protein [Enterococcus faecalis]MEB7962403.1 hypothetical protein [Enterococcus faecalis]